MFEPGIHKVHVVGSAVGKTTTGKEQIGLTFESENGQRITWFGYFTPKAWPITERALQSLGWDPSKYLMQFSRLHETDLLVGVEAEVLVTIESYEGQERAKVNSVNPSAGGVRDKMTDDELKTFEEELRLRHGIDKNPGTEVPF